MKNLRFKNNKKKSKLAIDQKEEIKAGKQYEKFYNLVKRRISSI